MEQVKKLLEEASRYSIRTIDALKEAAQRIEWLERQEKKKDKESSR